MNMRAAYPQVVLPVIPCPACASLDTERVLLLPRSQEYRCTPCGHVWTIRPYVPRPAYIYEDGQGNSVPYLDPQPVADPRTGDMTRGGPHAYQHLCNWLPLPNSYWAVCSVCSRLTSIANIE